MFPYDPELERTRQNMNRNMGINDDDLNHNLQDPVDVHGHMISVKINKGDKIPLHVLKNTTETMIILQTLMGHLSCPLYHKATPFVVTSSLMHMLNARGLFSGYLLRTHMPILLR